MNELKVFKIRKLRSEGKTIPEITKELNCCLATVYYWLNEENRQKIIKKRIEEFRNKTLEERRKIYAKRKDYYREWVKNKYHTNEEFRKNKIKDVIERRKK